MSKIRNEHDEGIDDYSTYCPRCGTTDIEKGQMSGQNFDDIGWYQVVRFTCKAPKCKYTWRNRVMLVEGGLRINW